jgi:hypothetical protein
MVYESAAKGQAISLDKGRVQFSHNKGTGFGELNTGDVAVQKAAGLKDGGLTALIEETADFNRGVVGTSGIWKRNDRISSDKAKMETAALTDAMNGLSDASLKAVLNDKKIKHNVNAPHDELVNLVVQAHSGELIQRHDKAKES